MEEAKSQIDRLKKTIHRSTFRIERADHHKTFLASCKESNQFPTGLTIQKKNINVMKGRHEKELHTAISEILKTATLNVVECLERYYDTLLEEERNLLDQSNEEYTTLIEKHPELIDLIDEQFEEILDARANRYHYKLADR